MATPTEEAKLGEVAIDSTKIHTGLIMESTNISMEFVEAIHGEISRFRMSAEALKVGDELAERIGFCLSEVVKIQ